MNIKCLLACFLISICSILPHFVSAQSPIRGKILDAQTRIPLPGANIIAGSTPSTVAGTATDENGLFELYSDTIVSVITISSIGYQNQTIPVEQNSPDLFILLEPSSQQLNEVIVTGYENNRKLLDTPASVALLTAPDLQRFSNTSFVPAINTIPGVRMEERSPGSYRVSIRGSLIRSPFGVRNVKVYWNELPYTDPGGNTAINLLDFSSIGRVEVIKGPAGSIYGAGTGGVLLLHSPTAPVHEQNVQVESLAGSFGLKRISATAQSGTNRSNINVSYAFQESDGYREHSAMRREMLHMRGQLFVSEKRTISLSGFYSDLYYQTPGGINLAQFEQNPRLSRQPTPTLPGSREQNAGIAIKTFYFGASQQYEWNERFKNSTAVYGTSNQFENPFITNYERRAEQGFGGRTRFTYEYDLGSFKSTATAGAEFQTSFASDRNYGNNAGVPDTLQEDDEITAAQYIVFAQNELELPARFFITLGASYNRLRYNLFRLSDLPQSSPQNIRFEPVFSPRIAVLKKFYENISVHASIGYGFSPPSITEVRPSTATINADLNPERGINYEMGVRGSLADGRYLFDIVGYSLYLQETIVRRTADNGAEYFVNAGSTTQNGVEIANSLILLDAQGSALSFLKLFANYTYNNFRYNNYQQGDTDFSGNRIAGVAPHQLNAGLDARSNTGLYANITANYTDRIPLNDANAVYANAYTLLGGRIGFRRTFNNTFTFDLFGGIDNALNETYSLGNDLNAFGDRYYNAAAARNYYGGLSLKYAFMK